MGMDFGSNRATINVPCLRKTKDALLLPRANHRTRQGQVLTRTTVLTDCRKNAEKTVKFASQKSDNLVYIMLTLELLGAPRIILDGQEITGFNTRKDLGLVIFLAESGASHSREELAGLLWSDLPEDKARRNLRNSLSNLRKLLGSEWFAGSGRLAWESRDHWESDTRQLYGAVQRLQHWTAQSDRLASAHYLQGLNNTLGVYKGEFLKGFHLLNAAIFEEWLFQKREEYRLLALQGLELLAERALVEECHPVGLLATRRLLSLEPWSEPGHVLRMKLLASSGQRAAALAQYESCRTILAEELGVEPLPETTAVYERIRGGAYGQSTPTRRETEPSGTSIAWATPKSAPHTPPSIPHNVPAALVPLIGYSDELAYVQTQLLRPDCRLLSIIGMGGAGKTHLSLEAGRRLHNNGAASHFRDGVYFVGLEAIPESQDAQTAASGIASAIAHALGFVFRGEQSRPEQIRGHLADKKMLLILDNLEHLLAGSRLISQILQHAPGLSILATSREILALQGERVVELWGLNPPDARTDEAGQNTTHNDAVSLFVYQAQMTDRLFAPSDDQIRQIERICQLVGGLPLAIEIAARWLDTLPLQAIEAELSASFDLLRSQRRDIPDRHHTLRAVFNHSWALLSPRQQQLLSSLGVFQPSFHSSAAEAIVGATPHELNELVKRSLLRRTSDTTFALHPAIHQFAREALYAEEERSRSLAERYVAYYLNLAANSAGVLFTSAWAEAKEPLYGDLDNFKVAIWQAFQGTQWDVLNNAFETVRFTFDQLGWYWEGRDLCSRTLELLSAAPGTGASEVAWAKAILIGRLMTGQAAFAGRLGLLAQSIGSFEQTVDYLRGVLTAIEADEAGAAHVDHMRKVMSFSLSQFGILKNLMGQSQEAVTLLQHALDLSNDRTIRPLTYYGLALAFFRLGEYGQARQNAQAGLDLSRHTGDQRRITFLLSILGKIEQAHGHYTLARTLYQESYEGVLALRDQSGIAQALKDLGDIARCLGDAQTAQAYLRQALNVTQQKDFIVVHSEVLWALGNLALEEGDFATAYEYFQESRSRPEAQRLTVEQLPILGWALVGLGPIGRRRNLFPDRVAKSHPGQRAGICARSPGGIDRLARLWRRSKPDGWLSRKGDQRTSSHRGDKRADAENGCADSQQPISALPIGLSAQSRASITDRDRFGRIPSARRLKCRARRNR